MTTRHALFAFLALSALLVCLTLSSPAPVGHAQAPQGRSTPTPISFPDDDTPPTASDEEPAAPQDDFPDLVVTSVTVIPSAPKVNEPITVRVTVANIGAAPVAATNNFFVDLYVNPDDPPRACLPGDAFWAVQGFEVGSGAVTLEQTFYPEVDDNFAAFRDVGLITLWAQVDTAFDITNNRCGNVVESHENNNLNFTLLDVDTRQAWTQTTPQDFLKGFTSALDLSNPLGVLQNGTGWFVEPRFPQPEDPQWPVSPTEPWNSPTFYNPDFHVAADNLPGDYPRDQLPNWNPPDQENVDIEIGYNPDTLFVVWEDGRNGDLYDRDIYFSYGIPIPNTSTYLWLDPVRVNQDTINSSHNQLRPQIVVDRISQRLFVFWEDNRNGDYDIYFARSTDAFGSGWVEPLDQYGEPTNPVNDKRVDPNADQVNVSVAGYHNDDSGATELYVAWEDYRNGNADVFFEWSRNNGTSWIKTRDDDPTTINENVHVQPDPSTNAGIYDQRRPHLSLDYERSGRLLPDDGIPPSTPEYAGPLNYCISEILTVRYPLPNGGTSNWHSHYYPANPLPRVFLVWEDERDVLATGSPSSIYYTRGEFHYSASESANDPGCANGQPRAPQSVPNLPPYRFEDDHLRVNGDDGQGNQIRPVAGFDEGGFLSVRFQQNLAGTDRQYFCEARFRTDEVVIAWQDDRDGTNDIWANNIFDDMEYRPVYGYVDDPDSEISNPPLDIDPYFGCRGIEQDDEGPPGYGGVVAPDEAPFMVRNIEQFSPQPLEFYDLAYPEGDVKISNGTTFTQKPLCFAPNEPQVFSSEPSEQTEPDLVVLPIPRTSIGDTKIVEDEIFAAKIFWATWADTRNLDNVNQDIFLRPVLRHDTARMLTVEFPLTINIDLPWVQFESQLQTAMQTVQDNIKNQIVLRELDLYENFLPPSAQQFGPSISYHTFDPLAPTGLTSAFYVGWHDNRNANPLIGFEGNQDAFAARLNLDDTLYGVLRPTRTGSFVSSVFTVGSEATWYDIEWWGDISADGVVSLQTRFGLDPTKPEPPQENVAANGWTQWTGIGGTGGFYTAPGQHITGPDGLILPKSYFIQYRVNFNPAGGGQQGISCLSEIDLNYEKILTEVYLPISMGGGGGGGGGDGTGAVAGVVTNAATGSPIGAAEVCVLSRDSCDTTDSQGNYLINNIPEGIYTVEAQADGFVSAEEEIEIEEDVTTGLNFALTPPLASGQLRAILTWGEDPRDLDSHLWLPTANPYHVLWTDRGDCSVFPFACLDVDDTSGFGPETLTISEREDGTYVYAVYLYNGEGTINTSQAKVQVYNNSGLVQEFTPPSTGNGRWWHVFNVNGSTGVLTPVNTISESSPGPYDPFPAFTEERIEK